MIVTDMNDQQLFFKVLQKAVNQGYRSEDVEKCECMTCILLSSEFAKAYWGTEDWDKTDDTYKWKAHLRRVVLVENRLEYYAKFL